MIILPVLGAILWLLIGRPRAAAPQQQGYRHPTAPDDDPDFLRNLEVRRRNEAEAARLKKLKDDLEAKAKESDGNKGKHENDHDTDGREVGPMAYDPDGEDGCAPRPPVHPRRSGQPAPSPPPRPGLSYAAPAPIGRRFPCRVPRPCGPDALAPQFRSRADRPGGFFPQPRRIWSGCAGGGRDGPRRGCGGPDSAAAAFFGAAWAPLLLVILLEAAAPRRVLGRQRLGTLAAGPAAGGPCRGTLLATEAFLMPEGDRGNYVCCSGEPNCSSHWWGWSCCSCRPPGAAGGRAAVSPPSGGALPLKSC